MTADSGRMEESLIQLETICDVFEKLIEAALLKAEIMNIDIYTFSVYHNYDSNRVSMYIDTEKNSELVISSLSGQYRPESIKLTPNRYLKAVAYRQAEVEINPKLPCYAAPNVVFAEFTPGFIPDGIFYLSIAKAIEAKKDAILSHSTQPDKVIFTCSTREDMFGLIWSSHNTY